MIRVLRAIFYIGPLLLWMGILFSMSTDVGSMQSTSGFIAVFVKFIAPDLAASLTPVQWEHVERVIRKAAHLFEYAVLMLLAVRAIQYGRPHLRTRSVLIAFVITALFAVTDEIHQSFVPSRTALPTDVLIDITGATIATVLLLIWVGIRHVERLLKGSTGAASRR
ncbi:MAG TPA: VanZ family protein [Chthonomonadales bacterium]|nr:VanZ family protein [Chthonomonadales bacterium]